MECHLKWNGIQNKMLVNMKFNSKWNVTQNEMSFKMEHYSKLNITPKECHYNEMSLKQSHSQLNVT